MEDTKPIFNLCLEDRLAHYRNSIYICVHIYVYIDIYICDDLVARSCLTLVTPWTIADRAPLSMEFSRQE